MSLEIRIHRPAGTSLVDGYVEGDPGARAFYEGWWRDGESYDGVRAALDARFDRARRETAARAMRGGGSSGAERLERWVEGGGYVVATGQQPGLFTGPLYSIYKALTTVHVASALEARTGLPVLPLFWVASEDHDFEESNHTFVVDVSNDLLRVEIEAPPDEQGRPLHSIHPGPAFADALESFLGALPETDFSEPFRRLLTDAYGDDATLPSGFTSACRGLLERFGLYFVDSADPVLRDASADLVRRELRDAERHEALLARRAEALEGAGYDVQVPILERGVNVFLEEPIRDRLYRDGDGFRLRHGDRRLGIDELETRLTEDRTLSPNVLLRPIVKCAVFPTLAVVVGPGEIAYFAQLAPYFEALDVPPPVTYPRLGATVLESKIGKVLDKFELEPEALDRPFHVIASEIARDEVPDDVRRILGTIRGTLGKETGALVKAARSIDPTLKGPVEHARNASFAAWEDAEKKIVQALKRENEVALAQLEKAALHLYPEGSRQERVLNVFYYLFRYGNAFLDEVSDGFQREVEASRPTA